MKDYRTRIHTLGRLCPHCSVKIRVQVLYVAHHWVVKDPTEDEIIVLPAVERT
jgi:hypothetical protein